MGVVGLRSVFAGFVVLFVVAGLFLPVVEAVRASSTRVVIVGFSEGFSPGVVASVGGRVLYVAELAPVAIVEVPGGSVGVLRGLPGVVSVSLDGVVEAVASRGRGRVVSQPAEVVPWGVDYIDADAVWSLGVSGWVDVNGDGDGEVEVAVIDSGVDVDHPDLVGNIVWGVAVLNGRISSRFSDLNGHGTHVAGTVAAVDNEIGVVGVSHSVELYIVKALGASGLGSWSDLIIAIDLAVRGPDGVVDADGDGVIVGDPEDDAPEVISMSLGGSSPPPELYDVIRAAYSYGVVLVAAAGNEGASSPIYPAAYPEVIAVGAVDSSGSVPSWSNRNPELVAPGVDILSTYPDDSYEVLSGTSMATPHVSGVVALIQAARLASGLPVLPPGGESDTGLDTVRGVLHATARDAGVEGYDELYGYGIVDAYSAVLAATSS